jgi:hypothetical protein
MKEILITVMLSLLMVEGAFAIPATQQGDRNLGDPFTFTINNVTSWNQSLPSDSLTYTADVYDYKIIGPEYTWWSDEWGKWFVQEADPGMEYLAVWVRLMSNGTRWWGWSQDNFIVWGKGYTTIYPLAIPMDDLTGKYNGGIFWPIIIQELQNSTGSQGKLLTKNWFGWDNIMQETDQLSGASNAWDGYVLYEIPRGTAPADLRVCGWFDYYGTAVWHFTPYNFTRAKQIAEGIPPVYIPLMVRGMVQNQTENNIGPVRGTIQGQ